MSYLSERKGLKCTFVCAALCTALGGYAAYSHIEKDQPNPMALIFAGIFGLMSRQSYKDYRQESGQESQAKKDTQGPTARP